MLSQYPDNAARESRYPQEKATVAVFRCSVLTDNVEAEGWLVGSTADHQTPEPRHPGQQPLEDGVGDAGERRLARQVQLAPPGQTVGGHRPPTAANCSTEQTRRSDTR